MLKLTANITSPLLIALALAPLSHGVKFTLESEPLVIQRLDPIMQPGQMPSNHSHAFGGANNLLPDYSPAAQEASTCTTVGLKNDLSSYWYPPLYYQNTDKTFSLVDSSITFTYQDRAQSNETTIPFPQGLKAIAGNPFRRVLPSNYQQVSAERAVSYKCGSKTSYQLPTSACSGGLSVELVFPSCWDGVNLMHPTLGHLAYPSISPTDGYCPRSHPKRLLTLTFNIKFRTDRFSHRTGAFVWAFGDNVGLGMHADYLAHWRGTTLQDAITKCKSATSISGCSALSSNMVRDTDPVTNAATACRPMSNVINENYGRTGPIKTLLGDNPIWQGTGEKTSCGCTIPTPSWMSPNSTIQSGWERLPCHENIDGYRLFRTEKVVEMSPQMSGGRCTALCDAAGWAYAAMKDGDECHCGDKFDTVEDENAVQPWYLCGTPCAGFPTENCGGWESMTVFKKSNGGSSIPSGWSYLNCFEELSSNRLFRTETIIEKSSSMTGARCMQKCSDAGWKYAGTKNGNECRCGDKFDTVYDEQATLPASRCNSACAGSFTSEKCGGSEAMSVYVKASSKRHLQKARRNEKKLQGSLIGSEAF